mmetsp:Transcript_32951/g.105136  ORF Transcript_32951/g.105136 Transcript_32951/m.105136 type:complete len:158 (+) Transcript_32951:129-602(+)
MVGRDVCRRPWYWASVDRDLLGAPANPAPNRRAVLEQYGLFGDAFEKEWLTNRGAKSKSNPRNRLVKPILNLFSGDRGSNHFKRLVEERARHDRDTPFSDVILQVADAALPPDILDRPPTPGLSRRAEEKEDTTREGGVVVERPQEADDDRSIQLGT